MGTIYEVDQSTGAVGDPVIGDGPIIGGIGMKLLWSNTNPSSAFAAQNIELANSDYDMLKWIVKYGKDQDIYTSVECLKGGAPQLSFLSHYNNNPLVLIRNLTRISDTIYSVPLAIYYPNGASSEDHVIPVAVYGIKLKEV